MWWKRNTDEAKNVKLDQDGSMAGSTDRINQAELKRECMSGVRQVVCHTALRNNLTTFRGE